MFLFGGGGPGVCSLCGSPGAKASTCPLNPDAKNPSFEKHPNTLIYLQQYEQQKQQKSSSKVMPPVPPPRKKPVAVIKVKDIGGVGSIIGPSDNPPVPPPRKFKQKGEQKREQKGEQKREQKGEQKGEQKKQKKEKPVVMIKKKEDIDVIPRFEENVKIKNKPSVCEPLIENKIIDRSMFAYNFRSEGISYLDKLSKNELKRIVCVANDAYYNENAFLTDDEYDVLREYVEKNDKTANFGVGAKATRNKIKLPYFMGSMNKIKPDTSAVSKWSIKYNGPYMVSAKLDGISGLFIVQDGVQKLYTRGDGIVGQDISHLIPYLRLPNAIEGVAIRGEFIMRKDSYQRLNNDTPARNYVAGAMNRLTIIPDNYKHIDFVAYELVNPAIKPSEQFDFLVKNCPVVVKHMLANKVDNTSLSSLLVDWRQSYEYEIDGIIVVDNKVYERKKGNPDHAFAFKMVLDDQIVEAKVLDVEWSASKHGLLKPRVRIEDVYIGGARIRYATGYNAKFIVDNKIGVGAVIKLIRSGDVIPKIVSVTKPASNPIMPSVKYHWNETNVDIIVDSLQEDETVHQKRLIDFFKKIEVSGAGPSFVERLHNAGYNTVEKVLSMSLQDFYNVLGQSSKTAEKIYSQLQKKLLKLTVPELLNASNILDRGFGLTRLEMIFESYPDLFSYDERSMYSLLMGLTGISSTLAQLFVSKSSTMKEFLSTIQKIREKMDVKAQYKQELEQQQKQQKTISTIYSGITLVFTGKRNKEFEIWLISNGATIGKSVNSKTNFVVADNIQSNSNKIIKANSMNIPVILMEDLVKNTEKILLNKA